MAKDFGATEYLFPTTMPFETLNQSGYIKSFPHHAGFVSYGKKSFDGFSSLVNSLNSPCETNRYLGDVRNLLSPTVCYHFFQTLKLSGLTSNGITVTGTSKCHRNEDAGAYGIERLNTFTMREIIFIDNPDEVKMKIKIFSDEISKILSDWGVFYRKMNATDPFFAGEMSNKRHFQALLDLKSEYKLKLPYADKWLAVSSVNYHRDSIIKSFNISTDNPGYHSGCIGFGLDRLAIALFSQFGIDFNFWPVNVKLSLGLD